MIKLTTKLSVGCKLVKYLGAWWKISKHLNVDKEEEIAHWKNEKGEKKNLPISTSNSSIMRHKDRNIWERRLKREIW